MVPSMGKSFWQKDSLITHILFELCLFRYLAQSTSVWDTLYINDSPRTWPLGHFGHPGLHDPPRPSEPPGPSKPLRPKLPTFQILQISRNFRIFQTFQTTQYQNFIFRASNVIIYPWGKIKIGPKDSCTSFFPRTIGWTVLSKFISPSILKRAMSWIFLFSVSWSYSGWINIDSTIFTTIFSEVVLECPILMRMSVAPHTQWAAVKITFLLMIEPPHPDVPCPFLKEITVCPTFDNVFHSDEGIARNWISMMAFWTICVVQEQMQPISDSRVVITEIFYVRQSQWVGVICPHWLK